MLETKYYKDFRHNYVILKDVDLTEDTYQCRMITENKIDGLLSCQQRHVDGESLFYYDISSKQSLSSFCEKGYVTINFLRKLLQQLQAVRENMANYLLTESCLLLKPEFVFMDMEKEEFFFLYFPFEADENYMLIFMEYLTDRIDTGDDEALDISYKMLRLMEREQFVLDEVLQWFEEDYPLQEEAEDICGDWQEDKPQWQEEVQEEKQHEQIHTFVNKSKIFTNGMGIAGLVFVVLFYIHITYQLSPQMKIYFYTAAAITGLLFLICGVCFLYEKRRTARGRGVFEKTDRARSFIPQNDKLYQEPDFLESCQKAAAAEYGNTVFIPWVENCENKLYGTGKGNKNHIDLNRLPLTVGKLAGSVDMVIADQSISRRHVKFSRDGNRICMTDLNSTNGTFRNGLRLEPNTSEILEPGDEIRLGKLKFIYR